MFKTSPIKTERLNIRPLSLSDNQFILELLNSEGWIENIGDRGVRNTAQAKSYITEIKSKSSLEYKVIETLGPATPIGILSFMKRDYIDYPDFGFALLPSYQQKGYANEASISYLSDLFIQQPELTIAAICKIENKPSIQLLERIGFKFNVEIERDGEQLNLYLIKKENLIHQ